VTILQQIDCNPQLDRERRRNLPKGATEKLFFSELGDPVGEPRYFAARRIAVDDALLRRADDGGLGLGHGGQRTGAIAGGDRLFNLPHCGTYARTPRFIDDGAARDLASGLLGGLCISHEVLNTDCREQERAYRGASCQRQRRPQEIGLSDAFGPQRVIARDHGGTVGGGELRERRLDTRPLWLAVNVSEERLHAGDQRFAVE